MFPLKRRRKFTRIYNKDLTAIMLHDGRERGISLKDISANGCRVDKADDLLDVKVGEEVIVVFNLNNFNFRLRANRLRDDAFSFVFDSEKIQEELNHKILTEYFKDTPELIPDKKL